MLAAPSITHTVTDDDIAAVADLFRGYAESLPVDLAYQDFAAELAGLPGKYAPPKGALLLARGGDGSPLGCVALRAIAHEGCCEMKRLFLLPAARGTGLGRALAEAAIAEARRLGYTELRLDTLPTMQAAQRLYEQLGFRRIAPYYGPVPDGTIFMALTL
jgi:GNAT superfamily N-acetyltransferase